MRLIKYFCEMLQRCLKVPQCNCEIYIRAYVFTEIMYEMMSLADLYHAFSGHYNLFQAMENYVTPEQTSDTLQKVIDWLK